jgi:hypothetical protein
MRRRRAKAGRWCGVAIVLVAAGCGVDGAPPRATTAATGATATTVTTEAAGGTATTTTTTEAAGTTVDPVTAVADAVAATVAAGTGRYQAHLSVASGDVVDVLAFEGEWDVAAGLLEVHVREEASDRVPSAVERTVVGDRTGVVYLRDPVGAPDPSRPWIRFEPGELPGGITATGVPAVPSAGDPPTHLVAALADATAVHASGDGFWAEVPMASALPLAQSGALLAGQGEAVVDQVLAQLPPTLMVAVSIDALGRLTGSADVTAVLKAVARATGEFDVDGALGVREATYQEAIRALGGAVHVVVPAPEEIEGTG